MPKNEAEAMSAAFDALKGQTPEIENRMLVWLHARLRENRNGREAASYKGAEPTEWRIHWEDGETEAEDTRSVLLSSWVEHSWEIVELTGHATVHQEFIVAVPVGDEDGIDYEHETFPTRDAAEVYVAAMTADQKETH